MRIITSETIVRTVKNLCLRANKFLPSDIKLTLDTAYDYEISPNGKRAIGNIIDNYKVSQQTSLPICQDTGMVVVFAEIGQDVHIVGELFEDAINEGVRQAYQKGNLRMSVVNDPLNRVNSQDNTPAIVHIRLVPGNSITMTVIPQGAGSENASSLKMFHPSATREDIIRYVVSCVQENRGRSCTPLIIGVGIGGTFSSPKITLGVKEAAEEAVKNIVDEQIQKLTGSESLSEEIQKQAENLRAEAKRTGEKLVEAAESQRAKLVEEASKTGALAKLAAEKAGDKLVSEAEKQAANLEAEAERQIEKLTAKKE